MVRSSQDFLRHRDELLLPLHKLGERAEQQALFFFIRWLRLRKDFYVKRNLGRQTVGLRVRKR